MDITQVLNLLNLAVPAVQSLVAIFKHNDGTTSAVVYLNEADAQFAANQQQINDWFVSKGMTPPAIVTNSTNTPPAS